MVSCSPLSQAFFGGGGMILDDHEDIMGASHFNQQSWEFTTNHEPLMGWTLCEFMEYKANHCDFFLPSAHAFCWVLIGF